MWLEKWQKTPMDLGLPREDLDPWYEVAMPVISSGFDAAREQEMRSRG